MHGLDSFRQQGRRVAVRTGGARERVPAALAVLRDVLDQRQVLVHRPRPAPDLIRPAAAAALLHLLLLRRRRRRRRRRAAHHRRPGPAPAAAARPLLQHYHLHYYYWEATADRRIAR